MTAPEPAVSFSLRELADRLECELVGRDDIRVSGIGTLALATPQQISFLANRKYQDQLATTRAAAVIVTEAAAAACPVPVLVSKDPYLSYAKLSGLFESAPSGQAGVHHTAQVDKSARIDPTASIAAYAVIGADCQIGEGAVIGPHCLLESDCTVGKATVLRGHVTLYRHSTIGADCLLHAGAVIGADGFGIAWAGDGWQKIAQLGRVVIGDRVEVGANTTIDRGAIGDTVIEDGVRLDNQVQIGHNCRIGRNTAMAGQSGIAGSSSLGSNCLIGGQVGISGHLVVADGVTIMQDNGVLSSISDAGRYSMGFGALPSVKNRRTAVRVKQLDEMARRLRDLEQRLSGLEQPAIEDDCND